MIGGYQDDNEETKHLQKAVEKNDVHEGLDMHDI